jgi:rubrerythrin
MMQGISREVEDAIKGAIKLEIDGKEFFNHAADIAQSERGKKMFQWLANEEVRHLEVFGKLFSSILKGEDWKKYVDSAGIGGEVPLIKRLEESLKAQGDKAKGEIEALRIGMELERNAIDFFRDAASKAGDPKAAGIFTKISEEEEFHYDILQGQLDSVTRSGFWLGSAEFQMDGKW